MPSSLKGVCENRSLQGIIDVEDTAMITLYGENEATIYATNAADRDYPVKISIQTDKGELHVLTDGVYVNGEYHDCKSSDRIYGKTIYGAGHRGMIYDFYDCVATGRKFPINGAEAVKAVRIVLTAYESEGKEIKIC